MSRWGREVSHDGERELVMVLVTRVMVVAVAVVCGRVVSSDDDNSGG